MLSMASALEKAKKTRCGVFLEVVTTSTVSGEIIMERIGVTIAPVSQCTRHLFNASPFFTR